MSPESCQHFVAPSAAVKFSPGQHNKLGRAARVDFSCHFTCPTLTPLYYAPIHRQLTSEQQLRYNQLTALGFNELILLFEGEFQRVLEAIAQLPAAEPIRDRLDRFMEDERRHRQMWRQLNRACAPEWYQQSDRHLVKVGRGLSAMLSVLSRWPQWFPALIWTILLLEEHSIEIARRCACMKPGTLEANFATAHRAHTRDEVRHVAVDVELVCLFNRVSPPICGRLNRWLFRSFIQRFWLRPTRAALCIVDALLQEFTELRAESDRIRKELGVLEMDSEYCRMMFSIESTPASYALLHPTADSPSG